MKKKIIFLFKIDLYIDEQLIETDDDNFRVIQDYPLTVIQGTEDTIFTLGACWHGMIKTISPTHIEFI